MSKKLMEQMTRALKGAGVELNDQVRDALSDVLGSESLTAAGLVELGSGKRVVDESEYNGLHEDLRKQREKRRNSEERVSAVETERDRFKTDLDKYKPLAEKVMGSMRETWKRKSELLPAEKDGMKDDEKARVKHVRSAFTFAETGKELSEDQVIANLAKFDEYVGLGILIESANGTPTNTNRGGGRIAPLPIRGHHETETPTDVNDAYVMFYAESDSTQRVGNAR